MCLHKKVMEILIYYKYLVTKRLEYLYLPGMLFSSGLKIVALNFHILLRFGKILIIQEVDRVDPILFPLLRGDLISQGSFALNIAEGMLLLTALAIRKLHTNCY